MDMTNRDLLETIIQGMNNGELADFFLDEDFKHMIEFDDKIEGQTLKEKMVNFLNKKAGV